MSAITQFSSFEGGQTAGKNLLKLFRELGVDVNDFKPASQDSLDRVYEYIWAQNTFDRPYQSVIGFFGEILRDETYDAGIMDVWGASELVSWQQQCAPICNLPSKSGFIQFGSWTGDHGDGDAWCLDIQGESITCLGVGSPESREEALVSYAYGILPEFEYFEAYLRSAATIREFL